MPTKYSESSLHRRCRSSHANVRSTIHPFATTLNPVTSSQPVTISSLQAQISWTPAINLPLSPPSAQINGNSVTVTATFGDSHLAPSGSGLFATFGLIGLELIPAYQPEDGPFWPLFFGRHHSVSPFLSFLPPD